MEPSAEHNDLRSRMMVCVAKDLRTHDMSDATLRGARLDYADLHGARMRCTDMSGADLTCADLTRADLTGALLEEANLNGADLRGAMLRGADLRGARLESADLRGATLTNADLRDAHLACADMTDVTLINADLRGAQHIPPYVLPSCSILPQGALIGFAPCYDGIITTLQIPYDSPRCNGTSRRCRTWFADVVDTCGASSARALYGDHIFRPGEHIVSPQWDDDPWDNNGTGIVFYITAYEAKRYVEHYARLRGDAQALTPSDGVAVRHGDVAGPV